MNFDEFYADRVANIEQEWSIFKEYIQIITPNANEIHELEWAKRMAEQHTKDVEQEGAHIDEEIAQLKDAVNKTLEEVNNLKVSKTSRIQQIARLAELSHPVQHDTTYLVPERFDANEAKSKAAPKLSNFNKKYKPIKTGDVLKLEGRVETETAKTSDYLQKLMISLRETEEERHKYRALNTKKDQQRIDAAKRMYEEVDSSEHQSFMAVSELLKLRLRIIVAQRQEVDELEKLQIDKSFYLAKEERVRDELLSELKLMERRMKAELQEAKQDFHRQLMNLDVRKKELELREEQALKAHPQDENFDEKLEVALSHAKNRYQRLRRRYELEMEGYNNEAAQLRQRLTQIEKVYKVYASQCEGDRVTGDDENSPFDEDGVAGEGYHGFDMHEPVGGHLPSIAEEQEDELSEDANISQHIGDNLDLHDQPNVSNTISSITQLSENVPPASNVAVEANNSAKQKKKKVVTHSTKKPTIISVRVKRK